MLDQMLKHIEKNRLLQPGGKLLLAVSGGVDSVVLAYLFAQTNFPFAIAHCNFQLRDEESDEDQRFVEQLAINLGCKFHTINFQTKLYASEKSMSVQMAARELRYVWFEQLIESYGYDTVATAHHLDDTAETFLINLMRGSGPEGLSGIPVHMGKVIRPLLFARRQEIEHFATKHQLSYRTDSSNLELKYLRNSIRQQLLPLMAEIQASSVEGMLQSIAYLNGSQELMKLLVANHLSRFTAWKSNIFFIKKAAFSEDAASRALLYECLKPFGFKGEVIQAAFNAMFRQSGALFFSSTYRLSIGRNELEVSLIEKNASIIEGIISSNDHSITDPVPLLIQYKKTDDDFQLIPRPEYAFLDKDMLSFPLIIRSVRKGDFFRPLGMKGTKLLSDFFIDNKFSDYQKRSALVLLNADNEIIWLIGCRINHRFRITDKTKIACIIQMTCDRQANDFCSQP